MKKAKYILCTLAFLLLCQGCGNNHKTGTPDAVSRISTNQDVTLTIVANKDIIDDPADFADELLTMCQENTFQTIKMSYDNGYPTSLTMRVYNWKDEIEGNSPLMVIDYQPSDYTKGYNIIDNPEEFELTIDGEDIKG